MKNEIKILTVIILITSMIGAGLIPSIIATDSQQNETQIQNLDELGMEKTMVPGYTGRLRVYVVEPVSRWNNYNQKPYHFGFLDFAFNENISLESQVTLKKSITWDGDATESNIMVIAVVSNSHQNQGYANPPRGYPFIAYYTDATAAAKPGHIGYNSVTTNFTHTVFIEEATAQYCPYCPAMAGALYNISQSNNYSFYFAALVTKDYSGNTINQVALDHLNNNYNLYAYPSAFIDGGYRVLVGGYSNEKIYINQIKAAGIRKVPALNLSVNVAYIGSGDLQIGINITSNNLPPVKPQTPSGESQGSAGTDYNFTTSTTDPNNDDVWYLFDWGDGSSNGEWIGPYASGESVMANHTWAKKGEYNIKVKAKDTSNVESDWSDPYPIKMPYSYNTPTFHILELLSQRLTNILLLLQQLKGK